jgi:hypothetical protein
MSWKTWSLLLSACAVVTGCAVLKADAASESAVIYRHRFVGVETVADLPSKPKAHAILSTTNAVAFRQLAEERFARWLVRTAGKPGADPSHLATAMDLLLLSDSAVEIRGSGDAWTGVFAAHLAANEGDDFIREVNAAAADLGLAGAGSSAHLTARREGDWVVAVAGTGPALSESELKARFNALVATSPDPKGQAGTNAPLLSLEADLPALSKLAGWGASPVKLGRLELAIAAQGEFLKTQGTIAFPETLSWNTSPWTVPTNLVHDPLVTFTAIRALGPFTTGTGFLADFLGKNLTGSQTFLWTQSEVPFQTYVAFASPKPDQELNRLAEELPARWNPKLATSGSGSMDWNTNGTVLQVTGLSLVVPQLFATNGPTGSWLAGGLAPPSPATSPEPIPQALLSQFIKRTNIVVYDWEITQERVGYWRVLSQIVPVIGQRSGLTNEIAVRKPFIATERFLQELSENLGNTITEVTSSAPPELAFSRKSHLGLSGFEIVYLARWMTDAPSSPMPNRGPVPATVPGPGQP